MFTTFVLPYTVISLYNLLEKIVKKWKTKSILVQFLCRIVDEKVNTNIIFEKI